MRHIIYIPALVAALGALLVTGSAEAADKVKSHALDAKACGAIAMGVAALGGTLGQGRAAPRPRRSRASGEIQERPTASRSRSHPKCPVAPLVPPTSLGSRGFVGRENHEI